MTLFAILALGFMLGLRHATDADHVMAMSALVSRERSPRAAIALGAFWGLGHTLTIVLVGGAIAVFGLAVSPGLGLSMEMSVAVMLILLGALNLWGGVSTHSVGHTHATNDDALRPRGLVATLRRGGRSLVVGGVHGLAGSAAVALLTLTTIGEPRWAPAYLGVFGCGTVLGMMLVTATMAVPLKLATLRFESAERLMARATGALNLAFGLFLAYRIGIVQGLLTGNPIWTPE